MIMRLAFCFSSSRQSNQKLIRLAVAFVFFDIWSSVFCPSTDGQNIRKTVSEVQPRIVKIMGSGGFQGLEPYQTGILISREGYVLTVWSYVLDDEVLVTLDDGQRFSGELVGYDPRTEIALLKIPAGDFSSFDLASSTRAKRGTRVLAFSNLYGVANGNESVSVQRGVIASESKLAARQGAFATAFQESVYFLDAMTNNPGAAGGAITTLDGRLIGLIGKELKDDATNTWLNFAIPIYRLSDSVDKIISGKMVVQPLASSRLPTEPIKLKLLGILLVPNVVAKTPPFVDRIRLGSCAQQAGLLPDDLVVEIDGIMTPSIKSVEQQLMRIDRDDEFEMTVQRKGQLFTLRLGLLR